MSVLYTIAITVLFSILEKQSYNQIVYFRQMAKIHGIKIPLTCGPLIYTIFYILFLEIQS